MSGALLMSMWGEKLAYKPSLSLNQNKATEFQQAVIGNLLVLSLIISQHAGLKGLTCLSI